MRGWSARRILVLIMFLYMAVGGVYSLFYTLHFLRNEWYGFPTLLSSALLCLAGIIGAAKLGARVAEGNVSE